MRKIIVFLAFVMLICSITYYWISSNNGVLMAKYYHDDSLIGKPYAAIQEEWSSISNADIGISLVTYDYSRWTTNDKYLVAVFKKGVLSDYVIYDKLKNVWYGTPNSFDTTIGVLSRLRAQEEPYACCDVGSGISIKTCLTCDGFIVAWTTGNETIIYDALTLQESTKYLLYRLVNNMLF